jgi:hypothetical protein
MFLRPVLCPVLCVACLLPAAARADCPTGDDMATGVEVTFANGDRTALRALGAGMVEVAEYYAWAPEGRRYFAYLGLYVTDEGAVLPDGTLDPASRITTTYPVPVEDMPLPTAETPQWEGTVNRRPVTTDPDIVIPPDAYHIRFAAMDPVVIGDCTYAAVAVGESLRPDQPDQKDQYSYYLPDLGAGFIIGWTIDGALDQTEAVAIRALSP